MTNTVFKLPQDISAEITSDDVIIHPYTVRAGFFKGKSVLTTNAVSFVISGEKIMRFAENTVHVNSDGFHFLSAGNCLASMDILNDQEFSSILIFFNDDSLSAFR